MMVLCGLLATLLLGYLQGSYLARLRRRRGQIFAGVQGLFRNVALEQDGSNYPVLSGFYHGHKVRLEPLLDVNTFRKLPVLWLLISYQKELSVTAPLDILLRPLGHEFYAPALEHDVPVPHHWPQHARITCAAPHPELASLDSCLGLLQQPETKELLFAAQGVRLTHMLAEAEQGPYRVLRRATFKEIRINENALAELLGNLDALCESVTGSPQRAAA